MSTIKVIDSSSVHQIQSGQVIIDLCSVVKELVENSLDAHASSVEIRFKNYGLDSIEVQDNGDGIRPEDYGAIALKHTTSKLSDFDDLALLQTFGFRGEALSSLSAISKLSIITKRGDEKSPAQLLDFDSSGNLCKTAVVAAAKGTTVAIGGVFQPLPVRRKDLEKNIKREYGKAIAILYAYASIKTRTRFSVTNQPGKGKRSIVFSTKSNDSVRENIMNLFGTKILAATIPLSLRLEMKSSSERSASTTSTSSTPLTSPVITIDGHVSKPFFGHGRQVPDRQLFYVNSRPCMLPQVAKAFNEVYKSFNVSQSPFILADLRMNAEYYDVNVSPDKRSILLHDEHILIEQLKVALNELFENVAHVVPATANQSKFEKSMSRAIATDSAGGGIKEMHYSQSALNYVADETVPPARCDTGLSDLLNCQVSLGSVHESRVERSDGSDNSYSQGVPSVPPEISVPTLQHPRTVSNHSSGGHDFDEPSEIATLSYGQTISELAISGHTGISYQPEIKTKAIRHPSVKNRSPRLRTKPPEGSFDTIDDSRRGLDDRGEALPVSDTSSSGHKELPISPKSDHVRQHEYKNYRTTRILSPLSALRAAEGKDALMVGLKVSLQTDHVFDQLRGYVKTNIVHQNEAKAALYHKPAFPDLLCDADSETAEEKLSLVVSKCDFAQMKIVGQFNLGFILAMRGKSNKTDAEELFIIDQHAADEKWNFERLQRTTVLDSQRLIQPKQLDLTAVQQETILQRNDALIANGFELQGVNPNNSNSDEYTAYQLLKVPLSGTRTMDVADLEELIHLLSELPAGSKAVPRPKKVQKILAMRACRTSIMVGRSLTSHQMNGVVKHLGEMDKPWNCPHGRPTLRHLASLGSWATWQGDRRTNMDVLADWKQQIVL